MHMRWNQTDHGSHSQRSETFVADSDIRHRRVAGALFSSLASFTDKFAFDRNMPWLFGLIENSWCLRQVYFFIELIAVFEFWQRSLTSIADRKAKRFFPKNGLDWLRLRG